MLTRLIPAILGILLLGEAALLQKPLESATPQVVAWEPTSQPTARVFSNLELAGAYGRRMIDEQCVAQPQDLWCHGILLRENTLGAHDIVEWSLEARSHFEYLADVVDSWRVHTQEALQGQNWRGDCDDLATTTMDMLIRAGQPRSRAWLVLANVRHVAPLDHLIAMVQDAEGHFWIVGDTSAQNVYPAERVAYGIVAVARMDDARTWLDPRSLGVFPVNVLD